MNEMSKRTVCDSSIGTDYLLFPKKYFCRVRKINKVKEHCWLAVPLGSTKVSPRLLGLCRIREAEEWKTWEPWRWQCLSEEMIGTSEHSPIVCWHWVKMMELGDCLVGGSDPKSEGERTNWKEMILRYGWWCVVYYIMCCVIKLVYWKLYLLHDRNDANNHSNIKHEN